ncbi:MAG: methyltransferase domain-containing protein [Thermoproteus sp.]
MLFKILLAGGRVDAKGNPRGGVRIPALSSPLGIQYVEFHEAVTRSLGRLDEVADLLRISAVTSQWYRLFIDAYVDVLGKVVTGKLLAPYIGEVFPAVEELASLGVYIYGYDKSREAAEDAAEAGLPYVEIAPDACGAVKAVYDAIALADGLHWSSNPYKELRCLADRLKPGGKLVVGNIDASSLPSVAAVFLWGGAANFFTSGSIEDLLSSVGFTRARLYLKTPYYLAVWEKA